MPDIVGNPGVFFQGDWGSPRWRNFACPPLPTTILAFWPDLSPPLTEFCPRKFQKCYLIFSLNFDYFLAQYSIRKLYFMLKTTKFAQILLRGGGGHFWPQRTIFLSSPPHLTLFPMRVPPIWLCLRKGSKIIPESKFPPTKNLVEKPWILCTLFVYPSWSMWGHMFNPWHMDHFKCNAKKKKKKKKG